jgi:hypothetical protein
MITGLLLAAALAGARAAEPAAASCLETFSVDGMLAEFGRTWTQEALGSETFNDSEWGLNLGLYLQCRTLAGDRQACRAGKLAALMTPSSPDLSYEALCRTIADNFTLSAAMIRGAPDRERICLALPPKPALTQKTWPRFCAVFARHYDDPRAAAAGIAPLTRPAPQDAARLEENLKAKLGLIEAGRCERSVKAARRERLDVDACLIGAAYRKAFAAGDPRLCGDHAICRVLMGAGPQACEAYAARVRSAFCANARR